MVDFRYCVVEVIYMMKRVIALLIAIILCMTLIACSNQAPTQKINEESGSAKSEVVDVISGKEKTESEDTTTIHSQNTTVDSIPSQESESSKETEATDNKAVATEVEPPQKIVSSPESTTNNTPPTEKKEEPKRETPVTSPTNPVEDTEPQKIETPSTQEVEKKVIEYVNQYRIAQGQTSAEVLNGLNGVAKYRAKQLVKSYEHIHPRTTCTELKYGVYVDLTEYGLSETDNYYEGFDKEALCKGDWYGTAEQIAQTIATGFKNSSVHWGYVGQSKYQYMGVGIYYDETTEMWYGCICMSKENYGG